MVARAKNSHVAMACRLAPCFAGRLKRAGVHDPENSDASWALMKTQDVRDITITEVTSRRLSAFITIIDRVMFSLYMDRLSRFTKT